MSSANRLAEVWLDLKLAVSFLTRIPVGPIAQVSPVEHARALRVYPLVGAAIGLFGGLAYGLAQGLTLGPVLSAFLALSAMIWLTGALHEDGWADTVEGLSCGGDRPRRLAVMRDPRLGTFGVLVLIFSLALRATALASLTSPEIVLLALITVESLSRSLFAATVLLLPAARDDGLGAALPKPDVLSAVLAPVFALVLAGLCLGPGLALGLAAVMLAATLGLLLLARRQLGGYSGDVLGAEQQVAAIAGLLALVALS